MLLLILEIVMFGTGLYALFTGKLPQVISGKKYRVEGTAARIIGAICAAPLPLAFMVGLVLGIVAGEDLLFVGTIVEIVLVIGAAIAASLMSRSMGQRVA